MVDPAAQPTGSAAQPTGSATQPTGSATQPTGSGSAHGQRGSHGALGSGAGRVLFAVYLIFAVAAGARAGVQIATKFHQAPVAYLLSAAAAMVYLAATAGLAMGGARGRLIMLSGCAVELLGVLTVGCLSVADPAAFPDDTVWSRFGSGYGYIPVLLPLVGLYWLWRSRVTRHALS